MLKTQKDPSSYLRAQHYLKGKPVVHCRVEYFSNTSLDLVKKLVWT